VSGYAVRIRARSLPLLWRCSPPCCSSTPFTCWGLARVCACMVLEHTWLTWFGRAILR